MRIVLADHTMHNLLARGCTVHTLAMAKHATENPEHIYTLTNGDVRMDGFGVTVIVRPDRTKKFGKILSVRVAEAQKS